MMASAKAQPNIVVKWDVNNPKPGQSFTFEAQIENYNHKYGTLNLFIEDMTHEHQWKLRYPLENGVAAGILSLPDSFPPGVYAFNFSLRRELVHIMGRVKDKKPPPQINYVAMAANKEATAGTIAVDADGYFQVPNLVFDEKASFVFSPVEKTKENWLDVEIETPVDSSFPPLATQTVFLTIGQPAIKADTAHYAFKWENGNAPKSTLEDVVVIGKAKTPAEKMVSTFMGGWFDGAGYVYDGLSTDEITTALSVFDYLMGRVPGLQIYNNKDSSGFMVHWRGFEPAYFIDGMETDQQGLLSVATSEIAVIKVIRPPFYGVSMGSAGGAILILTKKGQTGTRYGNKFRYVVNGYTPQEYTLY